MFYENIHLKIKKQELKPSKPKSVKLKKGVNNEKNCNNI